MPQKPTASSFEPATLIDAHELDADGHACAAAAASSAAKKNESIAREVEVDAARGTELEHRIAFNRSLARSL